MNKSASIRSAPPASHLRPRPAADQVFSNTRVLRVTSELSGRSYPDGRQPSESNFNVQYANTNASNAGYTGTARSNRSRTSSTTGTLKSEYSRIRYQH